MLNLGLQKRKMAELVDGVYLSKTDKEKELQDLCRGYFNKNKGAFRKRHTIDEDSLNDIFQGSMCILIENIRKRKIYAEDGEIKGNDGEPFTGTLTSYFFRIAFNKYFEWMRNPDNRSVDLEGMRIQEPETESYKSSIPYVHEDGYWYINGVSTGEPYMEVAAKDTINYQIPYIGEDGHWWIGDGNKAKDLGVMYDNFRYDDTEIKVLTVLANRISKMSPKCKKLITLFYYFEKDYDDIIKVMDTPDNKNALKTAKYKCLKSLRESINGANC